MRLFLTIVLFVIATTIAVGEVVFNGNMTFDGASGVWIAYNLLNLPEKVSAQGQEVKYVYSADGTKLATIAPNGSRTYYRSVFTYTQNPGQAESLLYVLHPEGIAVMEGSSWVYKYFQRDHVGSTRAVLAARGGQLVTEQQTDYYPFGLTHGGFNNLHLHRYLYGGKEYQDVALGGATLGLYDFHARYYNPLLGRWFNPDPANQLANPYLYCGNSPMMYVDPDGRFFIGYATGFLKGLFSKKPWKAFETGWKTGINEIKINAGLFTSDKRKDFGGQVWEIVSRFTWQLPQTALGITFSHTSNYAGQVDDVDYWGGATVLSGNNWGKTAAALTLSSYIIGGQTIAADPDNSLFQHEYGHYLQSQSYGLFYLQRYALPSLIDIMGSSNHNYHATEQDANIRAYKYFIKKVPGFNVMSDDETYPNGRWWQRDNPIKGYDWSLDYNDAANQLALKKGRLRPKWWDYVWRPTFVIPGIINVLKLKQ